MFAPSVSKLDFLWIAYLIKFAILANLANFCLFLSTLWTNLGLMIGTGEKSFASLDAPVCPKHGKIGIIAIFRLRFLDFLNNMVSGWTSVHWYVHYWEVLLYWCAIHNPPTNLCKKVFNYCAYQCPAYQEQAKQAKQALTPIVIIQ